MPLRASSASVAYGSGYDDPMAEKNPDATSTVGQSDELDRGTGTATSGGGLGKSTGFWSEKGARKDMKAGGVGDTIDGKIERDHTPKRQIVVDDELARPEEDRSPLT
jgi:hypothetical protein